MTIYLINCPSSKMPTFNVIHYYMYHGTANRIGSPLPLPIPFFAPHEGYFPLELTRCGSFIPDVFSPLISIVVSEQVKKKLRDLPNIFFAKVKFVKLVKEFYAKNDFSYPRDGKSEILNRFSNAPELYDDVGDYFELIFPTLTEITKQKWTDEDDDNEPRTALITSAIMNSYPIIWDFKTILSDEAYSRLEPFLDKDFYEISPMFLKT